MLEEVISDIIISSFVGGSISALLGAIIYQWINSKLLRKKLLNALKLELQVNRDRLDKNIKYLENSNIKVLLEPFLTKTYERVLLEDPNLLSELYSKTEGLIDIVYLELEGLNHIYNLMIASRSTINGTPLQLIKPEQAINNLKEIRKNIEIVIQAL